MKSVEEMREKMPLNLQFFAAEKDNVDVEADDGAEGDDGASTASDEGQSDVKGGSKDAHDTKSGKTFTQDQVNRMMTREKNQGRDAVYRELGINPKDSKMVGMVKALIESQKSDEQKDAEAKTAQEKEVREANERALKAEAKAEAMQLGVKSQYVDDVVALVLSKMTEDADLKTLISEYKTKYPIWFDDDADDKDNKRKTGQKGTGASVKASSKDKESEVKGLGARLAAQRKGGTRKTSYWS